MVLVLDKRKRPLMPCSERRARLLLQRGRAVVHRLFPFTIRLKDRVGGEIQSLRLKLDPGSKTTGITLVRDQKTIDAETGEITAPRWNEETQSEILILELFQAMGWTFVPASDLEANREGPEEGILVRRLETALRRLSPWLSEDNLRKAVRAITHVLAAASCPSRDPWGCWHPGP